MKPLFFAAFCLSILCFSCTDSSDLNDSSALASYQKALALVERSYDRLGTQLRSSGGIYLRGEGTYDLSTRLQGMEPNVQEPYEMTEQLAVDLEKDQVAYESDTRVNPDAREWIRYVYDGQNRMLFLEMYAGFAFWNSSPGLNKQSKRYSNMVPHLLLDEALTNRSTLRYLGTDSEEHSLISFVSPSYGPLTLYFDPNSHYLAGVEYLKDMPLLGDTPIRWRFKAYETVDVIGPYPTGYTVSLKEKLLKEITYTSINAVTQETGIFTVPDSINVPEMPDPPASGEPEAPVTEAPARDPVKLADGVHVFPHIRSGFHPMIIEFDEYLMVIDTLLFNHYCELVSEFDEYLMVIDTPAGWLEMQQLPAMQWVDGVTSSSTGRKLLTVIREKLSDKPIRYVALTHFHSDHAGGIRPFIDEGAAILASSVTAPLIRQAARNRFTLEPDELTGTDITPTIEIVDGERTISDGTMEVRLIDVGDNPHANGMLVAYLPKQKFLYQSDLFEPTNMNFFPNKSRVPVMKWFVNWLDNSGLDVENVYAIHAGLRVRDEHLEKIRSMRE